MTCTDDSKPLDDSEYPDPDEDDEAYDVIVCPNCRQEVFEDANQCPHCLFYISSSTDPWVGRPTWWIVLGVAGVALAILALLLT